MAHDALEPRAQIIIREHWHNKVWTVRPVTVVADTPEVIALYMIPGTTYKHPRAIDGSPVPHFLPDEWVLVDTQWFGGGALYLTPPGQWWGYTMAARSERRRRYDSVKNIRLIKECIA